MPLWAQITLTCVLSLIAGYVGAAWRRDSRFSRLQKRLNDIEVTAADLESSFSSLLESHKRLRSRQGMRDLREERRSKPETKAEARARIFGNKAGPDFAATQLRLAGRHDEHD